MEKEISNVEAEKALELNYGKAEKILQNKDDFEKFLQNVELKLKEVPMVGADLAVVPAMASLLKNFVEGKYRHVPYGTIVAITSSLLYFLSPIDIFPDMIPGIGLLDDAAVIKICLEMVKSDLDAY
ncbi:YkvA family protein, partial [Streptococcus merionis]|uniref:YkvA family protein n=1 Tax=Streptococcus merionis TaxID=400065 RepID=UPI0026F34DB4